MSGGGVLRYIVTLASACLFSVILFSGVSEAAGPSWASGFPKLSQKNALLQWSPVKGASGYKVYRSTEKGKNFKLIATVKANHHVDNDLPGGKTFYYYVSAVEGGKEGERSEVGTVSTPAEKVFVPLRVPTLAGAHVKEQPGGAVSVGIRWEGGGGTDLVGVNIYRSTKKGKDYALVGSSQSDTFIDSDVKQGETYFYVVTAVDSQFKETKYSNEVSASIPIPVAAAPAAAAQAQAEKATPTEMKKAKLLFRIPREDASAREKADFPLQSPLDVAVDEAVGHIYVTDNIYGGVFVYNMDGALQFSIREDGVNGKDKFAVQDLTVGENGNIYVTGSQGLHVFDFTGKPLETIKVDVSYIPEAKGLNPRLEGVVQSEDGTLYVGDPTVNRIHVYNRDRKRIYDITVNKKENLVFNGPSFMVVAKTGDLVFVDSGYSRLMVFGEGGKFKRTIGKKGGAAGDLAYPVGIANGSAGEILVASGTTPNIQAFDINGKFLYAICNEKADGPIEIGSVTGIYVDKQNRLYVAEGILNRVSVYQLQEGLVEIVPPK